MSVEVSVRKRFGSFELNAAFSIDRPGVTALFGPSGAGKTMIVNTIAGLLRPDDGRVAVNGRVLTDTEAGTFVPARGRRIGYVFQDARLFPHMTVWNNLLFGWRRAGRRAASAEIDDIVALLGLRTLLDRTPRNLSGGEKQRVALGRALLASPDMLLLDEPMASLDQARRAEVMPYLEYLRDDARLPMLFVSHSTEEVARLANQIVALRDGRVVAQGSVFDMMPDIDPAASVVIEASIVTHGEDGLTELAFHGGRLFVQGLSAPPGTWLRVRISAAEVMLAREEPQQVSANNILPVTIASLRDAGGGRVDAYLLCGTTRLVARITSASAARLELKPELSAYAIIKSVTVDAQPAASLGGASVKAPARP